MTEIVAEISGNHGGNISNAHRLIREAKAAGADAVKFQCFMPERQAIKRNRPEVLALAGGVPLLDLYQLVWTPWSWFPQMISQCDDINLPWFSSVFDPLDVEYMESLGCPRYKISAFEMLDWELIKAVKETGKPIVMSVRPTDGVTVLHASGYHGIFAPLGASDHGGGLSPEMARKLPMVEWHLKLVGVETPDSDFSLTPDQFKFRIEAIKKAAP